MTEEQAKRPEDNKNPAIEETRTSIDTLLEMLKSRGKSELNSIAIALNIDPRIIENWAKVLENGHLVHISYEVGRMYIESVTLGVEQQQDVKTKTALNKFILEEDLAVERISLDKFAKNIDTLNASINSIEKLYQQKLPDVQRILSEIDKAYAPIEGKKRSMDKIKADAESNFKEVNKKADTLYAKLSSFSPKQTESNANTKLDQLNKVLDSIGAAQESINDVERSEARFFKSLQSEIDSQTREFKKQIAASKANTDQVIRANSRQLNELIKGVKEQTATAHQLAKEVEGFRRQFEGARHDLDVLKNDFNDRYEKLMNNIQKDSSLLETESNKVTNSIKSLKQGFGDISKYDDEIKKWKKNVSDATREVAMTRMEILKLTNQLNASDMNKNETVETRAKAMEALEKEGEKTKERTHKIKKIIKDTANEISDMADSK